VAKTIIDELKGFAFIVDRQVRRVCVGVIDVAMLAMVDDDRTFEQVVAARRSW